MGKPQKNKRLRSERSVWSRYELEKLVVLVAFYQQDRIDFAEVARHLWNRSPSDVKKRWGAIRDYMRRKWRESLRQSSEKEKDPVPYQGELHGSLRWIETQWGDIEAMNL